MFRQRLITAGILIPIVLALIFYASPWMLLICMEMITLVIGIECWLLIPLRRPSLQATFLVLLLLSVWVCLWVFTYWLVLGCLLWLVLCVAVLTFPTSQKVWGYPGVVASLMLILVPLFVQTMIHLYALPQGKSLILYLLCLVWAADIGAYFAGKAFGHHKLIPAVSPGKSREGLAGGLLFTLLVAWVGSMYYQPTAMLPWFLLAACTFIVALFGDLFISILKRRCHVKDTGTIIHGHGGMLDRLDSLIAAAPVFYMGLLCIMR